MRILVTGSTGFIGQAVVPLLLERGHAVTALLRRSGRNPFPEHPGLRLAYGDMTNLQSLQEAMADANAVVHLAAAKSDEPESERINVGGARNLAAAAKHRGIRRIVNVSTQSARLRRKGLYGETKDRADAVLAGCGLPVTTLRASLVYGDASSGVFGSLVRFSALPAIPVFGNGKARFRPLHRDDLALTILAALERETMQGRTYDAGGPDALAFDDLLRLILRAQGKRRPIVHLPIALGLAAARVAAFLPHPPVTRSNVLGGAEDLSMDVRTFFRDSGVVPRSLAEGLREIFPQDPVAREREEGRALLSYALSAYRPAWNPAEEDVDRYRAALRANGLPAEPVLEPGIARHRWLVGALDAVTRPRFPHCVLQRKLLVAAAVAECHPVSAPFLLPRDRTLPGVAAEALRLMLRVAARTTLGICLRIFPRFIERNAGCSFGKPPAPASPLRA